MFSMRVSDNGRGFDSSLASNGSGLASMNRRARQIGGGLRIESAAGSGTVVEFQAKIP
jgi:signal transduction histidine kinase